MVMTSAMQRTMPTSTSYRAEAPVAGLRVYRLPRMAQSGQARSPQFRIRSAFNGQNNCGPRGFQGANWGNFNSWAGPQNAVQLDNMIREFARQFGNSPYGNGACQSSEVQSGYLPMDVEEQEGQYVLTADIPGLQKSDLKISVNQTDRTLKIMGERQRSEQQKETSSDTQPRFRKRLERTMGKFSRTINLDKESDLSSVSARVDKGVLTITIQKMDLAKEEDEIRVDID